MIRSCRIFSAAVDLVLAALDSPSFSMDREKAWSLLAISNLYRLVGDFSLSAVRSSIESLFIMLASEFAVANAMSASSPNARAS